AGLTCTSRNFLSNNFDHAMTTAQFHQPKQSLQLVAQEVNYKSSSLD
ncbi:3115_t:CDS:2, partial [Paraglomus occultum]